MAVAGAAAGIPSAGTVATIAFASAGALFAAFTAYLAFLYRARPNADCGCSRSFAAVNFWTPIRAAFLALAAVPPTLTPTLVVSPSESAIQLSVCLLAAVTLAVTAWILPSAMNVVVRARTDTSLAPAR